MSALNYRDGNHAWNNIINQLDSIIDTDWIYEASLSDEKQEQAESYLEIFVEDFIDYLEREGENPGEYPNKKIDIGYWFNAYMADPCDEIMDFYQIVHDWLQGEEDFAASDEYLDSLWMLGSGGFEQSIVMGDIEYNAEKIFSDSDNDKHGFSSAGDMVKAVNKAIDDGHLDDVDQYDAGGMGYHAPVDGSEDYFETGSVFLGNGEEELQMSTGVPFSEEYDYGNCYSDFTVRGDCIYTVSDRMYIYGVPWQYVEKAGDELGLRNKTEF